MTVRTGRVLPTEAFLPSAPLQREEYSYWRILIQIHVTAIGTNTGGGKVPIETQAVVPPMFCMDRH